MNREPHDPLEPSNYNTPEEGWEAWAEGPNIYSADNKDPTRRLAATLRTLLQPWDDEELEASKTPHPHVFQHLHTGLFPAGEVTIVASAGREGKTTVKVGIATALVTGHSLAGLFPIEGQTVVIYSAEDDRGQYARKVGAQVSLLGRENAAFVKQRIIVPNLDDVSVSAAKTIVNVLQGRPVASVAVQAIIDALEPMLEGPNPLGLLIFETASTLNDADEDNPGFRVLILALRRIARALGVAVVLSHHVSQTSLSKLSDLDLSTEAIRGATALVNNARQTALLVNLGSEEDPFPEVDARTVLRQMACPGMKERITALVTLDSSKGITPPPMFFRWVDTDWGPAAVEVDPPQHLQGKPWRKVHEMLRAERASAREQAKAEAKSGASQEAIRAVVDAVKKLHVTGYQPTAAKVSGECGRSPGWASPHLLSAVSLGLISSGEENVPRTRGPQTVFRPVDYSIDRGVNP